MLINFMLIKKECTQIIRRKRIKKNKIKIFERNSNLNSFGKGAKVILVYILEEKDTYFGDLPMLMSTEHSFSVP